MIYLVVKAVISAVIIVAASELAKRSPAFGALVASLPLVSVLGMIWLWRDTGDRLRLAAHAEATFWYVLPSLPMFLAIPAMLRAGLSFWLALVIGVVLTAVLYVVTATVLARFGVDL
ncbi:MAG: DUF3147 family protein [Allosphingosinicella sp.]|uniref:DUF3147 family protein n=1 Tax=Allosphingosinicella sp. TaxID=2823234 RepID=UPI003931076C